MDCLVQLKDLEIKLKENDKYHKKREIDKYIIYIILIYI